MGWYCQNIFVFCIHSNERRFDNGLHPIPSSDIDECADVQCGGLSTCVQGVDEFKCVCARGWQGGGANQVCTEVDECKAFNITCGGASKCVAVKEHMWSCECVAPWTGGGLHTACQREHKY